MEIADFRALLDYEPLTGVFTWKHGLRAIGGRPAGTLWPNGYVRIRVKGRYVYAHRLAYAFVHDRWADEVDPRDGCRANNAALNLRDCTRQQNQWNARKRGAKPTSQYKGVSWSSQKAKWHAKIVVDDKARHLGFFADEAQAGAAYATAAQRIAGEFARA